MRLSLCTTQDGSVPARVSAAADGRHVDRRPHVNVRIRAHNGDGSSRFQGDTLIVETTNIRDETVYQGANADRLRLVERFTPQPDGKLE